MTQPTSGVERGEGVEPAKPTEGRRSGESRESAEGTESAGVSPDSGHADHADHEEHESHGHSTAAWTAVVVILVGAVVMSLAVVFPSTTWFIVGAVVVVLGIVAGKVLAMAGYGDKASTYQAAHRAGGGGAELPGRQQNDSGTQ